MPQAAARAALAGNGGGKIRDIVLEGGQNGDAIWQHAKGDKAAFGDGLRLDAKPRNGAQHTLHNGANQFVAFE